MSNSPQQPLPYGSDDHGLICGYFFAPGTPAREVSSSAHAEALLGDLAPGFLWLHLNLNNRAAPGWMRAHCRLSEHFFESLDEGSRSTRIERDGDALFAVINDVTFDFGFDASDVATLWLSATERLVVTARSHPLRAVDRLRVAAKGGEHLATTVALVDWLLREQADELQRIVRRAAERLDDIEDAVLAGKHERHDPELARLRRLMVRLQRLLAPEPSALARTLAHPPLWIGLPDLSHLNRASEEFALVLRDVAALQERIKLLQDEAVARVGEENNRSLFTLTMVTVLALPINLTAGLLGMNVGGIPLANNAHGFWLMLVLIGLLTGLLAWLVLARIRPRR
jgi:zinc transporter